MTSERPLSPHLTIHKKVLTSIFSIFHRFSGIALSIGSLLITIWILLLALGPEYFNYFQIIASTFIFKIMLFFWSLTIFYHLYNGVRYLFWTFGKAMDLGTVYVSGYIVIFASIISTILVWLA